MEAHQGVVVGGNYQVPVLEVIHKDLKKIDDSIYRSECPTCKIGILLMNRDQKTMTLLAEDLCSLCGQHFKYLDIEELRKMEV